MIPAQTPWRTDPEFNDENILGKDGLLVADCAIFHKKISSARCAANARFIVRAVNNFDAMLALLVRYRNETPLGNQPYMIAHEADAVVAAAKDAK